MNVYYQREDFERAKRQRNNLLILFFSLLAVYLLIAIGLMIWNANLPYQSGDVTYIRIIFYALTVAFILFAYLILGIKFSRANKYYKLCLNLNDGLKEESVATFLEYDNDVTIKDGVDMKSLVMLEWNDYRQDYFERKVLVFYDKPFPEMEENQTIKFMTQGNVLINYEITQDDGLEGEE